ncbi:MAG: folate-binding protein YgfZ [Actinomycetota bacterium]
MGMNAIYSELGPAAFWRVGGERPLAFLQDVLTQDVASVSAGKGTLAALLTDKGRLRAVLRVLVGEGFAYLHCDEGSIAGVEAGIERFAPLGRAEMVREARGLFRIVGEPPTGIVPASLHAHSAQADAVVVRTEFGTDVIALPDALGEWRSRLNLDAREVDPEVLDAYRIRAGIPRYGVDVDEGTLINETPLINTAVSFGKGCYPGQESVARVRNLGRVRRRLVAAKVCAEAGDEVTDHHGKSVGRVTSAASDELGECAAFLLINAEAADAGELFVRGSPASVLVV